MDTIFLEYLKSKIDITNKTDERKIYNIFEEYCTIIENTYNYIQKEYYENISDITKEKQKHYLEKEMMDVIIETEPDYSYQTENSKKWYRFFIDKNQIISRIRTYIYYLSEKDKMKSHEDFFLNEQLRISQNISTTNRIKEIKSKNRRKIKKDNKIITMVLDELITKKLQLQSKLNKQDIFKSNIWKNNLKDTFFYNENKISIDRLINIYLSTIKKLHKGYLDNRIFYKNNKEILREKEKEFLKQTYTKKIILDNKVNLRFFLKHNNHNLEKENLTRNDIVIILEYCGMIYFGEIPNKKKFLSYKTNIKSIKNIFDDLQMENKQNIDDYLIIKKLEEEKKQRQIQNANKRIEEITYELATLKKERSILLNKKVEDKIKIDEKDLFEERNGIKYIKDKYTNNEILKILDLFLISFDNVDIRNIDFRGCNAFRLNPQTVYNKDLTNTKFDLNDGIFLSTTDFTDVNVSNMTVENSEFSLVSFTGSKGKVKKIT